MYKYVKGATDGITSYGHAVLDLWGDGSVAVNYEDYSNVLQIDGHTMFVGASYDDIEELRTLGADRQMFYDHLANYLMDAGLIDDYNVDRVRFWWNEQPANDLIVDANLESGRQWSVHIPGSYVWNSIDSRDDIDYAAYEMAKYAQDKVLFGKPE